MRRSTRPAGAPAAAAAFVPPVASAKHALSSGAVKKPAKAARTAPAAKAVSSAKKPAKVAHSGPAAAPSGHALLAREQEAWASGVPLVIGCDEAGRGPLAGPVVAAACYLPASAAPIAGVGDSKTITDEVVREALYEQIIGTPGVRWSARVVSAERVDRINILMGSLEAMRLSVVDVLEESAEPTALALIDGPFSPWKEGEKYVDFQAPAPPARVALQVEPIKGGDGKVYCIAAASIIAKVTRDRLMHAYDAEWPAYAFGQHKGYGTATHVAAIAKHGPCAVHRRTFAPLKARGLPPPSADEVARLDALNKRHGRGTAWR